MAGPLADRDAHYGILPGAGQDVHLDRGLPPAPQVTWPRKRLRDLQSGWLYPIKKRPEVDVSLWGYSFRLAKLRDFKRESGANRQLSPGTASRALGDLAA